MPRRRKLDEVTQEVPQKPPVVTVEDREDEMIALAVQLTERRLREGTASSQEIVHYLKLGSTKARLEKEKLIQENKLLEAKTESIKQAKDTMAMYQEAIDAIKTYSGNKD